MPTSPLFRVTDDLLDAADTLDVMGVLIQPPWNCVLGLPWVNSPLDLRSGGTVERCVFSDGSKRNKKMKLM